MITETKSPKPVESEFVCTTPWHMARMKSQSADVVYDFMCNVAHKTQKFYVSVERTANYLGIHPDTVRDAIKELVANRWCFLLQKGYYEPNVYQPVLNHKEWAAANPGQCCEKTVFVWTAENDKLGQALWAVTDGQIKPKSHIIKSIRGMMKQLGCSQDEVTAEFKTWYPRQHHAPKYIMGQFLKHFRDLKKVTLKAVA